MTHGRDVRAKVASRMLHHRVVDRADTQSNTGIATAVWSPELFGLQECTSEANVEVAR